MLGCRATDDDDDDDGGGDNPETCEFRRCGALIASRRFEQSAVFIFKCRQVLEKCLSLNTLSRNAGIEG
jgi:hypothetical protein